MTLGGTEIVLGMDYMACLGDIEPISSGWSLSGRRALKSSW